MKKINFLLLCSILFSFTACNDEYSDMEDGLYAEFITNKGTFMAELFYEATPITVASFVSLAEGKSTMVSDGYKDKKFYNGLIFHRVIKDFMIQGGDPEGTGSGDPGYSFPDEIVDSLQLDSKGILAMANSGPSTNGSQFFITLKETPWLTGMHTVFGKIVKGQEVVDSIGVVETATGDKPVEDVVIQEIKIIRKGNDAEDFNAPKVLKQELGNLEEEKAAREEKMTAHMEENSKKFEELKAKTEELPSGLKIYFNKKSNGEKPQLGQTVRVYYKGYLQNGKLFDTNVEEIAMESGVFDQRRKDKGGYEPMPMPYSPDAGMIAGFKEGVQQMSVGDVATLFIPAHLGYGERGAGDAIPPNSDIIFEVELVDIQK